MVNNKIAIASLSLGMHPSHSLPEKIIAAAQNDFQGIEIVYFELESYANLISISIFEAAAMIKSLCAEKGIYILALAPFENYEGSPIPIKERLAKADLWLQVARTLGAEHMQIPASFDANISDNHDIIISELRQLADLAAAKEPVIKIAYENLAWSRHCSLFKHALQYVQEIDRPNFGLCLDNFHETVALWADASCPSGVQPNGDRKLEESLQAFVKECPIEKLFYVQLSGGERMSPTYSTSHPWYDANYAVGHVWSMHARPFPLEKDLGEYMPVERVAQALLVENGFTGWVSLETFDRRMRDENTRPGQNAARAINSWRRLKERLEGKSRL